MGASVCTTGCQRRSRDPRDARGTASPVLHATQDYHCEGPAASVAAPPPYRSEAHRASDPTRTQLSPTTTRRSYSPLGGLVGLARTMSEQTSARRSSEEARRAAPRRDDGVNSAADALASRGRLPALLTLRPAATSPVQHTPLSTNVSVSPGAARRMDRRAHSDVVSNLTLSLATPPRSSTVLVPINRGAMEEAASSVGAANHGVFRSVQSVHGLICSSTENSLVHPNAVRQPDGHAAHVVEAYTANVRVLLHSWHAVCDRLEEFLTELCDRVAREYPDLVQGYTPGDLRDLMQSIVNIVGGSLMLTSRPEELSRTLLEVRALHRRFNVGEPDFAAVKDAFMSLLPKYLPNELQRTHAAVWEPHWRAAIMLMMHGFTSARGERRTTEKRMLQVTEARGVMGDILMQLQLADRVLFMQQMVDAAIAGDESMKRLAVLRDRRVAISAFHGLVRFLRACDDPDSLGALMDELLPIYYPLGLDAAAVRALRQPFIDTCKKAVQRARQLDHWSPRTSQSLGVLWDLLTETWEEALERSEKVRVTQTDRAPDGSKPFCLIFTDIEAGTRLWQHNQAGMAKAVLAYQCAVRALISEFGAYEVKTVGDSFVIAAKDVLIALRVALAMQLELMSGSIAKGFEMVRNPEGGGPPDCWRRDSLRVRIGIHYCRDASAVYDSVHQRYDYYGPSVNVAARTMAAAWGGQILMTRDALEVLQDMPEFNMGRQSSASASDWSLGVKADPITHALQEVRDGARALADLITVRDWGQHSFKGVEHRVHLVSILPKALAARTFPQHATPFVVTRTLSLSNASVPWSAETSASHTADGGSVC